MAIQNESFGCGCTVKQQTIGSTTWNRLQLCEAHKSAYTKHAQIEDFITNNYQEPMSSSDKAEMFEHIVDIMDVKVKP